MFLKKPSRFKPKFKKLLNFRVNIQNNKKIFNFNKKKWERFIFFYKKKLKWYNRYKQFDQQKFVVSKFSNKFNRYKNRYKTTLTESQKFRYFYGGFHKKNLKKNIKNLKRSNRFLDKNFLLIKHYEYRLDTVLYRSKFCLSISDARQLINHGKVKVNGNVVSIKSYNLKPGDLIEININSTEFLRKCGYIIAKRLQILPIPPKHLYINYKTMQIKIGTLDTTSISSYFTNKFEIGKIILNFLRH